MSVVEACGCKFVILDAPNDSNVHIYLEELKKQNVGHVVRVCDPTYGTTCLTQNNIAVHVRARKDTICACCVSVFSRCAHSPYTRVGNAVYALDVSK